METATDFNNSGARDERTLKEAARDAARRARTTGGQELQKLIADVEELISRVADSVDPEVKLARARATEAIAGMRRTMLDSAAGLQRQAKDALTAGDNYVRESPWEAIGAAAVAGLVIGFLVFRR